MTENNMHVHLIKSGMSTLHRYTGYIEDNGPGDTEHNPGIADIFQDITLEEVYNLLV